MEIINKNKLNNPLASLVFSHLLESVALLPNRGPRTKGISHRDFILSGVLRPIIEAKSGRDALHKWADVYDELFEDADFARSSWFAGLHSAARLEALITVGDSFRQRIAVILPDRLAAFPELAGYDVWTGDGHWHEACLHDQRYLNTEGAPVKLPVGHIYFYNNRSGLVLHFDTCADGTQEHDMSVLHRKPLEGLRRDAKEAAKVDAASRGKRAKNNQTTLVIYDRAAVDFTFWNKAKRKQQGTVLITRDKAGLVYCHQEHLLWDEGNPINARILSDELVMKDGELWRRITTTRADQSEEDTITILTNDLKLPPGLVCILYHRRWDIERVYDDVKHKFHQDKAWASSQVSKTMQGEFIALSWNVIALLEHELAEQEVTNVAEEKRRAERTAGRAAAAAETTKQEHVELEQLHRETEAMNPQVPGKVSAKAKAMAKIKKPTPESRELYQARRIRIPVKLIRWLRIMLHKPWPWPKMLERLRVLYATL